MSGESSARVRLYRERQRGGLRVLKGSLALDPAAIRGLVAAGVIPPHRSDAELLEYAAALLHILSDPALAKSVRALLMQYAERNGVTGSCDDI